ncbi:dihydrofolate reductase family protein [Phytoactinopolyspora mesophila]|uniref:Dihydrofolate reductase n=1 Tax=Phytoactinopolyspora mesophila TaxID=2650750 RepID=A0A7K3MA92_9ACTN|nr:dihydrofolate reductase family protein [Phytoactinopolyspora mesophila]NDL60251.1 dihydrofolate reductase [Phytoactinopolyspora mesophila]
MAGKVFFSVTMTLDGYVAPEISPADIDALRGGETTPGLKQWMGQWSKLQAWVFGQRFFRENLKFGEGGEEGRDNAILEETFHRTGASVMGKRMFDLGEVSWPEEAPFHTPVYVVTHEVREPWERPGGTTFHFVNDGIESALEQARKAAGDRDVRIAGGGDTILQYLNAGLVDEFSIALAPVLFGGGVQLFDGIDAARIGLQQTGAESSSQVTHLNYAVVRT